ncbi:hypothetical protein O7627_31690 [Solwaraspora sp. WMMD1047]|uniref:hypothetical protein n=1 Tax=Solwaraspora sp. WMMD1047 TaxID=3016102 RepID=UPI00241780C6|nr:hypothetical protein [Solwaraspora sp. WMMD1047]MDG4833839.1 hypothetical protein [Solwaraspora sp. WMMD1047]
MRTPRPASAARFTAALCLLAVLAGACGGGPAPRAWAASVCQALAPWRAEISTLTSSAQQQMTAKTTPAQAQENLVRLFGGAEQASETARRSVQEAGVPDVDRGDVVSREFLASLTAVRDAYGQARRSIEELSTGEAGAFYAGVKTAIDTLNQEYDASALDTSELDSVELQAAFDEVPECR